VVQVLFDDTIQVSHHLLTLSPVGGELPAPDNAAGGQRNGLLGAAIDGALVMSIGSQYGSIPIRIEVMDSAPPIDPEWEEVVEASFIGVGGQHVLSSVDDVKLIDLPVGVFRARWSGSDMDLGSDLGSTDGVAPDHYLLQLWPAAAVDPDVVLRHTSRCADRWHDVARRTPPPPSAAELARRRAELDRQQAELRAAQQQAWERQQQIHRWGGVPPTAELLAISGRAEQLAYRDRGLLDSVVAMPTPQQRVLALWCARRALEDAGVTDRPAAVAALRALTDGAALPAEFDDWRAAFNALEPRTIGAQTFAVVKGFAAGEEPLPNTLSAGAVAVDAVLGAAAADPTRAAVDAVDSLLHGERGAANVAEIRRLFLL
jgi:hypothetical protein